MKRAEPKSKVTPKLAKPKRKLSAAGRKAIPEPTSTAAAVKSEPAIARTGTAAKTAPVQAGKRPSRRVAKKTPAKEAAVKAPAKKAVKVVRAAKVSATPKGQATAVETPEQVVPEAPVQEVEATAVTTREQDVPEALVPQAFAPYPATDGPAGRSRYLECPALQNPTAFRR